MKLLNGILYTFLISLGFNNVAFAAPLVSTSTTPATTTTPAPISFFSLLQALYGIVFPAVIIVGFLKVVIAGYTIMTSQGDPKSVAQGKEDLTAAIMGMIFILGAVGILRILVGSIITGGNPGF